MNDFDFDELDKAVSSLASKTREEHGDLVVDERPQTSMSSIPAVSRSAAPAPVASREEAPKPRFQVESPSMPTVAPQKHANRLEVVRPQPNPRAFMDIVPPSARKTGVHTAMHIQPVSKPENVAPEKPSEPAVKTSEVMKLEDDLPMVIEQPKHTEFKQTPSSEVAWPDPLDFHEDKTKEAEQPAHSTPFLSEAKVEKRPLGAYSNFQTEAPVAEPPKPEKEITPVADEPVAEEESVFDEPKASVPPKPESSHEGKEVAVAKSSDGPENDMHSAAMMSIPQQYRTQDKSTDKTTRPIFDTKEYHPPLVEKAMNERRGSGMWTKLFIALVVLVLLAVGGYFVYIYVVHP